MLILRFLLSLAFLILASGLDDWSRIVHAIGENKFEPELEQVSRHASALRNGIQNVLEPGGKGGWGYIARLRFSDGVTWAAKISEAQNRWHMEAAARVLHVIEHSCPDIPIPKIHGHLERLPNSTLIYYLSDWIDGHSLLDDNEYHVRSTGPNSYRFTIPEKTVTQLAEFFYNLTTCRIPFAKRMHPALHPVLTL